MHVSAQDIPHLLRLSNAAQVEQLLTRAYATKVSHVGKKVFFRGIIEFSNLCVKDCYYCGIRKSNPAVDRYQMTKEEILESALWAHEHRYGSIVLQSGERHDERFIAFVEEVLREIKERSSGTLGVTLSLGEQERSTYERWFQAGAHRYLLRIETSSEELYRKLHPADHSFNRRRDCLIALRELGYQVGTGVMIGLPFQTIDELAKDILFFKEMDIDMIGMGPYVPHAQTPLHEHRAQILSPPDRLDLALKMIAVTRLFLKDVNIAATTALQALSPIGRERGLKAGANIIMPIITNPLHRAKYQLYDNKPCIEDTAGACKACLSRRISSVGEEIGYGEWGDSPHHQRKRGVPAGPGNLPDNLL